MKIDKDIAQAYANLALLGWMLISGPDEILEAIETACRQVEDGC